MSIRTDAYPTIPQAWGIFGVLILAQIVASPIQLLLDHSGIGLFLMYCVALSIGLVYALWHKSNKIDPFQKGTISTNLPPLQVLIEHQTVPFIIYLLCVFAIPGMVMISGPIANLIPVPDFFMEQLESIMTGGVGIFHFLTIVIAAAFFEEAIFRGIILDGFLRRYSPKKSILYSAFLFALVHLNPLQFPHTFILGIFIGWIYYRTKSIWPCIWIHLVNNGMVFFLASGVDQIEPSDIEQPSPWALLSAIPIGLILLYGMIQLICSYLPNTPIWQSDQEEE